MYVNISDLRAKNFIEVPGGCVIDLEELSYLLEIAEDKLTDCTCPQCTLWASLASRYIKMVDTAIS